LPLSGTQPTPGLQDPYQRIWKAVARIPRGRVATYGQIAQIAGLGRQARQVGYALHKTPPGMRLPWHRVITARGAIAFPRGTSQHRTQRARLLAEKIVFIGDRIDLSRYRWRPDVDDLPREYLDP